MNNDDIIMLVALTLFDIYDGFIYTYIAFVTFVFILMVKKSHRNLY